METRISRRTTGKLFAAAAAVGLSGIAVSQASAAVMTEGVLIDVRATHLNGVPVANPKHVWPVQEGDVVSFQLFAFVTGTNGVNDEGFQSINGAIRSSTGGLHGDLAAQLISPFTGTSATAGTRIDVDSDGDLDVSGPNPFLFGGYFSPRANMFITDGTRISAESEQFLIGGATFTVAPGEVVTSTVVNYLQHRTTSGANNLSWGVFLIDSNNGGTSPRHPLNTAISSGDGVLIGIPEPTGLALAGLGSLGLLARRKKNDD